MLVDDHALMRTGLRMMLETQDDFQIVAECETGQEAIRCAQELRPDVILMDIALPDILGIEATRRIKQEQPKIGVLALTMYESDTVSTRWYKDCAVVPKPISPAELLGEVRRILDRRAVANERKRAA